MRQPFHVGTAEMWENRFCSTPEQIDLEAGRAKIAAVHQLLTYTALIPTVINQPTNHYNKHQRRSLPLLTHDMALDGGSALLHGY
jgi:hypothetical protein